MEIRESDLLFDDSYGIVNTDANGQFSAILTSGQTVGVAGVRAELLYDDGNGSRIVHTDRK